MEKETSVNAVYLTETIWKKTSTLPMPCQ